MAADKAAWRCGAHVVELRVRTVVMGIVNVTPDSFSDGGQYSSTDDAVRHAIEMAGDGADLLDVGGESTRPGSDPVSVDEEQARVVPVIEGLARELPDVPISVDTRKPEVARAALEAGASIVNDISAGREPEMFDVVRASGAGMVLMHMKGEPKSMQEGPTYHDVVAEVRGFLGERVEAAIATGIGREHLCVDPGIGFGKTLEHNLELLRRLDEIAALGFEVVIGTSRKSFLGRLTGRDDPHERVAATVATIVLALERGATVFRVHDVAPTADALKVAAATLRRDGP
jgi:dihydropteroate synthase